MRKKLKVRNRRLLAFPFFNNKQKRSRLLARILLVSSLLSLFSPLCSIIHSEHGGRHKGSFFPFVAHIVEKLTSYKKKV